MKKLAEEIARAAAGRENALREDPLAAPFPPDLPTRWRTMFETGENLASWERHTCDRFDRQSGERRYEVVDLQADDGLPSAFRAWLDAASRETTGLRGVCPACDGAVRSTASGFVSNRFEYRAFSCCGAPFYLISCFRRRGEYCVGLVEPDRARLHVRPGRVWQETGADTLFVDALLGFKERCVDVALAATEDDAEQTPAGPHPHSLVLGRGDPNPGHVLFQDLTLILRRLAAHPADAPPLRIYVPTEGHWYIPLVREAVGEANAEILRFRASFDRMSSSLAREGQYVENEVVVDPWPDSRNHSPEIARILTACEALARRGDSPFSGEALFSPRIVLHVRLGNRRWAPVAQNVKALCDRLKSQYRRARFVIHAEGATDGGEGEALRRLSASRDDITTLFDPSIESLLATIGHADLCLGPIGSGFWWAGLLDVSAVTLHPHGDRSNITIYEWIAAPPKGQAPPFLGLHERAVCRCIEEPPREAPRVPFEDLSIDPEVVARAAIDAIASAPRRPGRIIALDARATASHSSPARSHPS